MANNKVDIYQKVADQLVEMMETMGTGWTKPWRDINQPINLISRKAYRGMNVLLLVTSPHKDRTWATFKQWTSKGYQVQRKEDVGGATATKCGIRMAIHMSRQPLRHCLKANAGWTLIILFATLAQTFRTSSLKLVTSRP